MIIDTEVKIRWNGANRQHYEDKGYKYTYKGDDLIVKIEDLSPNSTFKVNVVCDYCNDLYDTKYLNITKGRKYINKDSCSSYGCQMKKLAEVNLFRFGVSSATQREEVKIKLSNYYRTPFEEVKKIAENKNLILLSDENVYKNDRCYLEVICRNHQDKGIQKIKFSQIKATKYCCKYGGDEGCSKTQRADGQEVYDLFIKSGLEPLFAPEDYINNSVLLPYICPYHREKGVQYKQYSNLKKGQTGCSQCVIDNIKVVNREDEKKIFQYFKNRGLVIIEGQQYINKDVHIKFLCPNHQSEIQSTSYSSLQKTKQPCKYCRYEESLTAINRRLRSSIIIWIKETEKQCGYKCVITGSKVYDVHHVYSFNDIIIEALDNLHLDIINQEKFTGYDINALQNEVVNLHKKYGIGICIDPKLHIVFHKVYGKKNNNANQIYEFVEKYINGEFNEYIKELE